MFGSSLIIILLLSVMGVLVTGVVLMGLGGKANEKYANRLMVARVTLQALVLLLLVMMFATGK